MTAFVPCTVTSVWLFAKTTTAMLPLPGARAPRLPVSASFRRALRTNPWSVPGHDAFDLRQSREVNGEPTLMAQHEWTDQDPDHAPHVAERLAVNHCWAEQE